LGIQSQRFVSVTPFHCGKGIKFPHSISLHFFQALRKEPLKTLSYGIIFLLRVPQKIRVLCLCSVPP
jgi:hypothetical protein